jgi:hypothetical protein
MIAGGQGLPLECGEYPPPIQQTLCYARQHIGDVVDVMVWICLDFERILKKTDPFAADRLFIVGFPEIPESISKSSAATHNQLHLHYVRTELTHGGTIPAAAEKLQSDPSGDVLTSLGRKGPHSFRQLTPSLSGYCLDATKGRLGRVGRLPVVPDSRIEPSPNSRPFDALKELQISGQYHGPDLVGLVGEIAQIELRHKVMFLRLASQGTSSAAPPGIKARWSSRNPLHSAHACAHQWSRSPERSKATLAVRRSAGVAWW